MSRALRIFLTASIALGVVPVACRQRAPVQRQADVRREVKKDTRVVVPIRDTTVVVFFRDMPPTSPVPVVEPSTCKRPKGAKLCVRRSGRNASCGDRPSRVITGSCSEWVVSVRKLVAGY